MNEKSKKLMSDQKEAIKKDLKDHFQIDIFEDEIAEDEEETLLNSDSYHCFILETSDFRPSNDFKKVSQNIIIEYYSENRDDVDAAILDIITIVSNVKLVYFSNAKKQRLQVKDMDRYIDFVTLTFQRMIPIECQV